MRKGFNIKRILPMVFLIIMASVCDLEAQNDEESVKSRPTVGVVLCGGGAKGFSQIRILKALDEAGVPIDYIGGTSIGSIIGALYAVGYDPDVIEQLVREQDWNTVLYDRIPKMLMPIDKKIYDRRYLATFPIENGKIKVKSSMVDGVCVNLLLSRLMIPAHNVHDFNDLPVPFFCVATDVEHAAQYEMTEGALSRSVRASMSIPFLFRPVRLNDKLLIDGGMINNFPVRNMQERGADIIIGVDLEDATVPASKIDNSLLLLSSLLNLSSLEESMYAKKNCNIYIKPDLRGRDMLSFGDFDSIIQFGEDAAREFYPKFERLADSLQEIQPFTINRPHVQPVDAINVVDINVEGIPHSHDETIKREFSKTFPQRMSIKYIEEVIMKLGASGYYEDLWYEITEAPGGYVLKLHCTEIADMSAAVAIHYDNNYGIGALVNFTVRNLVKSIDRSTLSMDINIAENPYLKVKFSKHHRKYFRYGADVNIYSVNMSQYDNRKLTNSYSIQDNSLDLYAQLVPNQNQQIRFGAVADYVHMKDFVGDNGLENDYHFYSYLYLNYFYENEDAQSFVRRGWRINLTGKCVFFEGVNSEGTLSTVGLQNSFVVHGDVMRTFPIGKKNSLKFGLEGGYKIGKNDVPNFYKFYVGGQSNMKYFDNVISFTGLDFVDKSVDHIAIGKLAWQWNFYKSLYSTVSFDFGYMSDSYDEWFDSNSFVAGAGITLGIDTILGPVELSMMKSNVNSRPVGFINVGYWF